MPPARVPMMWIWRRANCCSGKDLDRGNDAELSSRRVGGGNKGEGSAGSNGIMTNGKLQCDGIDLEVAQPRARHDDGLAEAEGRCKGC
jgi:hypothetical protein